ncbi:hypothetical protein Ancab_032008 [Ancistrocladus abbreviatus]
MLRRVFFSIARDIKQRLAESDSKAEPNAIKINPTDPAPRSSPSCAKISLLWLRENFEHFGDEDCTGYFLGKPFRARC